MSARDEMRCISYFTATFNCVLTQKACQPLFEVAESHVWVYCVTVEVSVLQYVLV